MTGQGKLDDIGRATAGFAVLLLLFVLAAVGDWSGAVALIIGIALGVSNAEYIREFFSE